MCSVPLGRVADAALLAAGEDVPTRGVQASSPPHTPGTGSPQPTGRREAGHRKGGVFFFFCIFPSLDQPCPTPRRPWPARRHTHIHTPARRTIGADKKKKNRDPSVTPRTPAVCARVPPVVARWCRLGGGGGGGVVVMVGGVGACRVVYILLPRVCPPPAAPGTARVAGGARGDGRFSSPPRLPPPSRMHLKTNRGSQKQKKKTLAAWPHAGCR